MKKFGRIWVFFMIFLFTLVMIEGPGDLLAQEGKYPTKPLNLICGSAAGAPIDIMARQLAKLAEKEFGQRLNVINKTGGSGIVAVGYVLSNLRMDIPSLPKGPGLPPFCRCPMFLIN
jgi:tripartite-type tricarboxylate transporter receptor subunit TctC